MKYFIFSLYIILAVMYSVVGFADSCPYCGQEYGDPMPGDEARVYELRRQHEASCGGSYERGASSDQHTSQQSGYEPYERQAERERMQEQQRIITRQKMMQKRKNGIKRYKEEKKAQEEAARIRKETFDKNKSRLVSSLKTSSSSGLQEVTNPESLKVHGGTKGLKITGAEMSSSSSAYSSSSIINNTIKGSYEKSKEDLKDKAKETIFKKTIDEIPGLSYARGVYEKYKKMRSDMEELNLNIFQYAMRGLKDGVRRLGSADIYDGGFSSEYEYGREELFGNTLIKSGEMLKDEVGSN